MLTSVHAALARAAHAAQCVRVEKTIFASPAGKKKLAPRLAKLVPPHQIYVEPFAGSAALLFEKEPSRLEVIGDADPEIADTYAIVQRFGESDLEKLARLDWTSKRETFEALRDSEPKDPIAKVHRFMYLSHFSFGVYRKGWNPARAGWVYDAAKRIRKHLERLKRVRVHCGDYRELVKRYDSPETFFFLDPPYVGYDAGVRESEFDDAAFLDVLKSIKGNFLVNTGTRGPLRRLAAEAGFTVKRWMAPASAHRRHEGGPARQAHVLIANYDMTLKGLEMSDDKIAKALAHASELVEKTIFSSPAGKKHVAAKMAALLPQHRVYVEPFVGSGSVLFAKEPAEVEVINDADHEIAHAFATLKRLGADEISKLEKLEWVGSKETFDRLHASRPTSDLMKLHRFLYTLNFSFMKQRRQFDTSRAGRVAQTMKRVRKFGPRLANVSVYKGDYETVVRKYDGPDTVFFLDPPYVGYDGGVREKQFDERNFFEVLKGLKGKFLVNYGVRGELPKLAKQHGFIVKRMKTKRAFQRVSNAHGPIGGSGTLTHTLIMNYEPVTKALEAEFSFEDFETDPSQAPDVPAAQSPAVKASTGVWRGRRVDPDTVKKKAVFQGIPIHIDRPAGFEISGTDAAGNAWTRKYLVDYGFIPRTQGGDGDGLDVFLGPDPDAPTAFWIEQKRDDESFDEFKVLLGFRSESEAIDTYKAHVPEKYLKAVSSLPVAAMKCLLGIDPAPVSKRVPPELAKWRDTDPDALQLMLAAGPPNEWSGAVASMLGSEMRKRISALWDQMGSEDRELVQACFERAFATKRFEATSRLIKGINPDDERYVLGIVLEPETLDAQNDIYSAEEIRNAAHVFMEEYGGLGLQHQRRVGGLGTNGKVKLLESYIMLADTELGGQILKRGTWMMAVRVIDDELWNQVKTGALTGFSIGGSARRVPEQRSA